MNQTYKVYLTFTEPLLGVVPQNKEVYATWVEIKKAAQADETPPDVTGEKSWTGFNKDEDGKGLYLYDYHIKGYFKEVAGILPKALAALNKKGEPLGETAIKHRLDNQLFILPRKIYLGKDKPDGVIERPLRAKTLRGDRIALARSDYVAAGTSLTFQIEILEDSHIKEETLKVWLDYGRLKGIGQFRTGSYGRFTYELKELS